MIEADQVSKTYCGAARPAVDAVSLSVGVGEVVAVIGHNGAGKSTLFDILGGLIRPDHGSARRQIDIGDIGWCPQREIIDWSLTVRQNISLGLELRLGRHSRGPAVVDEVADVLGLAEVLGRQAETLSGGQLRRAQIARAIAGDPRLMILDEPTTGLDPEAIHQVFTYLKDRTRQGASAIVSTHETSRFSRWCTRVVALHQGRVIADATVEEFMASASGSDDLWDGYTAAVARVDGAA